MNTPLVRSRRMPRQALTLMELVVVMVILAAVAGIVLPLLPSMLSRAHTTSGATNVGEVAKIIQTHEALNHGYPANFDSLIVGTGLPAYLPGSVDLTATAVTPTEEEYLEALEHAGVVSVRSMVAATTGDWSPTFFPYGDDIAVDLPASVTAIDALTTLPVLNVTAAQRLGLPATVTGPTYVVFGLGGYTTMQGKSMQEAPVHFGDSPAETPANVYSRLGVVFQVSDAAGNALHHARLAQIVAFHEDGLEGISGHLAEYYEAAAN
jgi:prepilin-type N-terminal cleavage/methylation domain-containing protein